MMYLYESGNYAAMMYEADAFRKYFTRKQKEDNRFKKIYEKSSEFYKWIKFLYVLRQKRKYSGRKEFRNYEAEMHGNNSLPEYGFWYEEKIKELQY